MTDQSEEMREAWPDGQGPVRRDPDGEASDALIVDVAGFEGPLDLLLELARHQKIDLARISILALAEQYLAFIDSARSKRIEIAADYLVMAAWLAYLKSRLLLPGPTEGEEPAGEELAERLAFASSACRRCARPCPAHGAQPARPRCFERGEPEPLRVETRLEYANNLVDLLKAYAERRKQKLRHQTYTVPRSRRGRSRKRASYSSASSVRWTTGALRLLAREIRRRPGIACVHYCIDVYSKPRAGARRVRSRFARNAPSSRFSCGGGRPLPERGRHDQDKRCRHRT